MPFEHTNDNIFDALGIQLKHQISGSRENGYCCVCGWSSPSLPEAHAHVTGLIPKARRLEAGSTMTVEELERLYRL